MKLVTSHISGKVGLYQNLESKTNNNPGRGALTQETNRERGGLFEIGHAPRLRAVTQHLAIHIPYTF